MPERPANVPEAAFWSEDENEWCLAPRDAEERHHGLVRWWRPDGTLCCETEYVHGDAHGTFRRFHENGEVSREGRFEEGQLHGTNAFFRSSAETTENFPAGLGPAVARAEMDYARGRVVAARCYDAQGRQCMEDGAPFPERRPEGVPEDAHFRKREADRQYRWVSGAVLDQGDGTILRVGTWRFWTPEGVLVAEEPYEQGQLHGLARTFAPESGELREETAWCAGREHGPKRSFGPGGELLEERTYAEGKKKGPRTRLISPEERREGPGPVAVRERGEFDDDDPIGPIEYLDQAGGLVARIDTGLPDDLEATRSVLEADSDLLALADRLAAERKTGAALLALARAVGRGEAPAARLSEGLAALARPWSDQAEDHPTRMSREVARGIARFGGGPDKCVNQLFEGIRRGGWGAELIRVAASMLDDMDGSALARELVDAALAVAPPDMAPKFEYTRALVRASLGDRDGALASIARFAEGDPGGGRGISAYLRALFPDWTFWPNHDSRRAGFARLAPLLTRRHSRRVSEAAAFRAAIMKSATRLMRHRARLLEKFGPQAWIAPDVSRLLPDGPVEVPIPESYGGIGIQHLARQEWTRLSWLCHLAGLDELGLPEEAHPRQDGVLLHLVGRARVYLAFEQDAEEMLQNLLAASDVAAPSDHPAVIERTLELARASDWFGLPIGEFEAAPDPSFIQEDERAFLGALDFSGDAEFDLFGEREEEEEEEAAEDDDDEAEEEDPEEDGED
jgi:antitoxin component YwqK of YwqJK toxin-antitoxin module